MQLTRNPVIRSVLPIAVVGLVLAGCTTKDPGSATPGGGSTSTTTKTSEKSTATSEPSGGGDKLARFDACAELNAVASRFSLSRVEKDGARGCTARWGQTTTAVGVKAFPEVGLSGATGGSSARISDTTVGSRKAKRVEAGLTDVSCLIAVEVNATSRVDFYATSTTSVEESCDTAKQLAEAIEPKLPK
ncbi:subtilisin inhibitor-like [Saccharothrix australiensis]|uniref:Subtilisin inhibitor-like n=2 Tax=Saccharothrix australiensis TaxID=2072 RepID=A0A495VQ91_9PSEU|nr:subtilisin inhibitor-like [Saccharothrix australiensis]